MYATVEQADLYVTEYYSSSDKIRTAWESLDRLDKQSFLRKATQLIDLLPLKGVSTAIPEPPFLHIEPAFPRKPNEEMSLAKARIASIELAVQINGNPEAQQRLHLQKQGVKSYKIGDLSETFKDVNEDASIDSFVLGIVTPYLREWLGGGYRICPTRKRR